MFLVRGCYNTGLIQERRGISVKEEGTRPEKHWRVNGRWAEKSRGEKWGSHQWGCMELWVMWLSAPGSSPRGRWLKNESWTEGMTPPVTDYMIVFSVFQPSLCMSWSRDWVEKSNDSYKNDKWACPGPAGPFQAHLQVECVCQAAPYGVICDSREEKGTGSSQASSSRGLLGIYEKMPTVDCLCSGEKEWRPSFQYRDLLCDEMRNIYLCLLVCA